MDAPTHGRYMKPWNFRELYQQKEYEDLYWMQGVVPFAKSFAFLAMTMPSTSCSGSLGAVIRGITIKNQEIPACTMLDRPDARSRAGVSIPEESLLLLESYWPASRAYRSFAEESLTRRPLRLLFNGVLARGSGRARQCLQRLRMGYTPCCYFSGFGAGRVWAGAAGAVGDGPGGDCTTAAVSSAQRICQPPPSAIYLDEPQGNLAARLGQ